MQRVKSTAGQRSFPHPDSELLTVGLEVTALEVTAPVRMGDETHLASEDDALLEKQQLLQSSVPCWQCWFCLHLYCNCTFAHLVLAAAAHFGLVWLLGFFFVFWSSLSTLMRDFVSGGCA